MKLASSDAGRIEPRRRAEAPPRQPTARQRPWRNPADAPPGLYLRSLLAPKTEPVSLTLHWTVMPKGSPDAIVFSGRAASPHVPVPPGRYVVEARDGAVSASTTAVVGDNGPTAAKSSSTPASCGSGRRRRRAVRRWAMPSSPSARRARRRGQEGCRRSAARRVQGQRGRGVLPAGAISCASSRGWCAPIGPWWCRSAAKADRRSPQCRASAALRGRQGSRRAAEALIFSVAEDDPDAPSGRREVARSAARQADFVLPPGTYYVIARLGSIEARESLAVGPGDVVKRTLGCRGTAGACDQAGRHGRGASEPSPTASSASTALPRRRSRPAAPAPVLLLLGGRYRVEGRYGCHERAGRARGRGESRADAAADPGAPGRRPEAASHRGRRLAPWRRCSGTSGMRREPRCGPRASRSRRRRCRRAAIRQGRDAREALRPGHRAALGRGQGRRADGRLSARGEWSGAAVV